MTTQQEHLKDLREIRTLMERSSRFIGLSGLSGVAAGICALVGASIVYKALDLQPFNHKYVYYDKTLDATWGLEYNTFLLLVGGGTALAAILSGILFTTRRAKKKGQTIWDKTALRLLVHLGIPLATGGIFSLALLAHGALAYIAPATLIFYGLALVNGSKYTLHDVFYLGLAEIGFGLLGMFNLGYGLDFWTIGFGVLHIVYGAMMYFKYERD